jgi:DNA-binding NarL/FixJ family response regulator
VKIRVVVVDDHQLVKEGICSLLKDEPEVEVIGDAADGRAAVRMAEELAPDVVLMDVALPGLNGVEATRQIVKSRPRVRVLALSMYADGNYVSEMLKAGAAGYLLKDCDLEELTRAIRTVAADHTYLSPQISNLVVSDYLEHLPEDGQSPAEVLTPREREVLQLLAEGKSVKDIAAKLKVSIKTVETHRRQIMEKLDIHSIAELTKYAIRRGLTNINH